MSVKPANSSGETESDQPSNQEC